MSGSSLLSELRDEAPAQPNLDYQVEVTEMIIERDTVAAGGITKHHSGGKDATRYLGTWVRRRCLGHGGYGVVYLEANPKTGDLRAVKRLEGGNIDWYEREITQMVRVKRYSKLFVDFYCWYSDRSYTMYVAMEYHRDGDLKQYIKKHGPFPEAIAKGIAQQVLQGVFVLHELEIMHRDIKPENILVVSQNPVKIKIADFGQAKKVQGSYNTKTGTDGWSAPEIAGQYYNGYSGDMWSVGCVIYYLLTSLNPFLSYAVETTERTKTTTERTETFTFHFWPRLHQHSFQEYSDPLRPGDKPKRGDQIVVKGISNIANSFLNGLIIHDPMKRMTAHKALNHPWICQTSPLQAALEGGDFRLASLLALHDPRYNCKWEGKTRREIALIVLRIGAAGGHRHLVSWALTTMHSEYDFKPIIKGWNAKPALLGAATIGSLPIVEMLFNKLGREEQSQSILLNACNAALKGGHHEVVDFIWPLLSTRERSWNRQLSQHLALYGNPATLGVAYQYWMRHSEPSAKMELRIVHFGDPSSAYAYHFPTMIVHAAEHGKTKRVEWFLKTRPSPDTPIPDAALLKASEGGHLDTFRLLLKVVPVEMRGSVEINPLLATALITASFYGHIDIVKCLVERRVMPSATAINEAVNRNNSIIFRYLIDSLVHKFKQDSRQVANYITAPAVPHCDLRLIKWLCRNRADLTFPGDPDKHVRHAARFGATEIVKWFITRFEKDRNAAEIIKQAVIGASEGGHVDIMEHLCKMACNAQIGESWVGAAKGGHIAILDLLLKTNPKPRPGILRSALIAAVAVNRLGTVLRLLCAGARLEDGHGKPLKYKCQRVIQDLLDDFGSSL